MAGFLFWWYGVGMAKEIEITDELVWGFWPGGQTGFAEDWEHPFVALEGGQGAGKSWIGARKLLTLHRNNAFDDNGDATYVPSAVLAPTYSNLMDFDVPMLQEAMNEVGMSYSWRGPNQALSTGQYSGPGFVLHDFGTKKKPSALLLRTADSPKRITGWEVGAAWGDEAARWKDDRHDPLNDPYIQLMGRVRHPDARFIQRIFTYTNEGDATRIYEEFHAGHPTHALYRARTKDNLKMADFYEIQKALLPGDLAKQYLDGGAMNLRGRTLYSMFDEGVHVVNNIDIVDHLPLHLSMDFNIAPGMHAEIGQYDPINDIFTTVHEIHAPRLDVLGTMDIFIKYINDAGGWKRKEPLEVYGDATGGTQHWAGTGETCYQLVAEKLDSANIPFRLRVSRSNPFVKDRVNTVNAALEDATGTRHWQIHERCEVLIADLKQMRYDNFGEPDKTDQKYSHASEAEGYRIYRLRPIRRRKPRTGGRTNVSV